MSRLVEMKVCDTPETEGSLVAVNLDSISMICFSDNSFLLAGSDRKFFVTNKESWEILRTFFMQNVVSIVKELK